MPDRPDLFAAAERPYLEVTLQALLELIEQPDTRWPSTASGHGNSASPVRCCCSRPICSPAPTSRLRLGGVCAPLLPQRWEQAWTMPLTQWREELGIAEELRLSPFAAG